MAHIYNVTEWMTGTGYWTCGDISDLGHGSNYWWIPCRILNISPESYVHMLAHEFEVDYLRYDKKANVLIFSWKSQSKMREYKNFINKKAREVKAYICHVGPTLAKGDTI